MKQLVLIITSFVALVLVAQEKASSGNKLEGNGIKVHKMTPEMREHMRRKSGGVVPKPGSQKGKIAFIDTQDIVTSTVFHVAAKLNANMTKMNVVYEKASPGEPEALKKNSGADVAIIVVADEKTPAMLAAVEDGWAVVNVKKLDRGLKTPAAMEKFYAERCLREVIRAFTVVSGGVFSQYPGNIMSISKVEDLDLCKPFIPMDKLESITTYLGARDVTPLRVAPYRKACQEGWAPAPTNDYQKAIWEKVHAPPSKPLKITYDKDNQKPVVK